LVLNRKKEPAPEEEWLAFVDSKVSRDSVFRSHESAEVKYDAAVWLLKAIAASRLSDGDPAK